MEGRLRPMRLERRIFVSKNGRIRGIQRLGHRFGAGGFAERSRSRRKEVWIRAQFAGSSGRSAQSALEAYDLSARVPVSELNLPPEAARRFDEDGDGFVTFPEIERLESVAPEPQAPRDRSEFTLLRDEGFPLNVDPEIVPADQAPLGDDDIVMGVVIDGQARKALHPSTGVYVKRSVPYNSRFSKETFQKAASTAPGPIRSDDLVPGLEGHVEARAYLLRSLANERLVEETFEGAPILVYVSEDLATARVYERKIDDRVLSFRLTPEGALEDPRPRAGSTR